MKVIFNDEVEKDFVPITLTITLETIEEARTMVAIAEANQLSGTVEWEDAKGELADNLFSNEDFKALRTLVQRQNG